MYWYIIKTNKKLTKFKLAVLKILGIRLTTDFN